MHNSIKRLYLSFENYFEKTGFRERKSYLLAQKVHHGTKLLMLGECMVSTKKLKKRELKGFFDPSSSPQSSEA